VACGPLSPSGQCGVSDSVLSGFAAETGDVCVAGSAYGLKDRDNVSQPDARTYGLDSEWWNRNGPGAIP
jgi:hypothetical protein